MKGNVLRILLVSTLFQIGCGNTQFSQIGASVLSSTGMVSETQARGLFDAGGKLAKSQESLTPEQEYYLGRAVSAKILAKYPPVSDPQLIGYVNKVGRTLAAASDMPETFRGYRFMIVDSNTVNAMSAPSGFVYVTKGFLSLLPNEDALAAVLAHEVAHIVKQHGVNAISNANLFQALTMAGQQGASIAASRVNSPVPLSQVTDMFGESVSGVVDKLLTSGFDRRQEYEADEYAANLLQKTGYDPRALRTVLEILQKQKGIEGGWFETHPDPADRLDEVDDAIKGVAVTSEAVATRAARFAQAVRRG